MSNKSPLSLAKQAMIEIPEDKLTALISAVYNISRPVGMGRLHYRPGPIPDELLKHILGNPYGIHMDYLYGRQCKFSVQEIEGHYFISKSWPDHSAEDLAQVLKEIGVEVDSNRPL